MIDMHRVELLHVTGVSAPRRTPKNDQATAETVCQRHLAAERPAQVLLMTAMERPAPPGRLALLPATLKKVYDKVMVLTSRGSLGSMTNTTGHSFFRRAPACTCLKQKQSSLLKCVLA